MSGSVFAFFLTMLSGMGLLNARAATSSEVFPLGESSAPMAPDPKNNRLRVRGQVKTESFQYPTTLENQRHLNHNNLLQAELGVEGNFWQGATGKISGLAGQSLNLNDHYVAVEEAYAGRGPLYLGRKINDWSRADEDWNLGLWQPLFQHDSLRPIPQGLTGAFYTVERKNWQILGFASPIFIPTMSPTIAERDGSLVAESRWFRSLPAETSVLGRDTQLVYKLNVPEIRNLVMQPGYGARVRIGNKDQGPSLQVAYARKPINSLFVKYDAAVVAQSSAEGQIEVSPVVHHHQLWSADLEYRGDAGALGISVLMDTPDIHKVENKTNTDGFETDYYQQEPQPLRLVTLRGQSQVQLLARPLDWTLLYLRAETQPTGDYDSQGVERSRFIPHRLMFTNAASVRADWRLSQRWQTRAQYTRDFDQEGHVINGEVKFAPERSWALHLGFDVLGVDREVEQENDTRFINSYRQNDRVYGGVSYVF